MLNRHPRATHVRISFIRLARSIHAAVESEGNQRTNDLSPLKKDVRLKATLILVR